MKKLPLFIIACLLVSFFSGCDEWRGSSKPEPQPEKPKSNTHTRSLSVACSADGKTVYWIYNDEKYNSIDMYKSVDGGETWVKIDPYPVDPDSEFNFEDPLINNLQIAPQERQKRKAVPIPRNGK